MLLFRKNHGESFIVRDLTPEEVEQLPQFDALVSGR